jgi:hypothetical protein
MALSLHTMLETAKMFKCARDVAATPCKLDSEALNNPSWVRVASDASTDSFPDNDSELESLDSCAVHTPRRVFWGGVEEISYKVRHNCEPSTPRMPRLTPPGLEAPTTVMFQKLPTTLNRASLQLFLDMHGFHAQYDFLYLPQKYESGLCLGFAFVNFVSNTAARCAMDRFSSMFELTWSQKRRGLQENVEHYRNTALMSPDMPDAFKPILLVSGLRVEFPAADTCKKQARKSFKSRDRR